MNCQIGGDGSNFLIWYSGWRMIMNIDELEVCSSLWWDKNKTCVEGQSKCILVFISVGQMKRKPILNLLYNGVKKIGLSNKPKFVADETISIECVGELKIFQLKLFYPQPNWVCCSKKFFRTPWVLEWIEFSSPHWKLQAKLIENQSQPEWRVH